MGRRVAQYACPRWCVADHAAEDEFGEVRHRSALVTVPVVARAPVANVDLMLELHSSGEDATVWLYLGDGTDQRLEVTLESARRLAVVLGRLSSEAG